MRKKRPLPNIHASEKRAKNAQTITQKAIELSTKGLGQLSAALNTESDSETTTSFLFHYNDTSYCLPAFAGHHFHMSANFKYKPIDQHSKRFKLCGCRTLS
jgi:hypothetical protein